MFNISVSISELIIGFIIIFSSMSIGVFLTEHRIFFHILLNENINELIKFYDFICENNPLLLNYYDDEQEDDKSQEDAKTQEDDKIEMIEKTQIKYEDKYLDKFKTFPNEFRFDETEFKEEDEEYERTKLKYEKNRLEVITTTREQLFKINEILNELQEKGNIDHIKEKCTKNINAFGINSLIKSYYFEHEDEDEDEDQDDFDVEELYQDLLKNKEELLIKLNTTEKMIMTDEEMRKKSIEVIINKKLDKFTNNYILESTPLGNIIMRYNNDKKSFEYFSNNTIPYRYLEPVGRRYVMTYWCKPIFVDMNEELKKSEERYDEDKKKKEDTSTRTISQFKSYNKETKDHPMKNRLNKNIVLPPQIQSNLPNVNKISDKQILKENANRYTWEGRLTNFSPLKKINKKIFDNKLEMTYADFKKLQQDEQNKK